MTLSTHPPSDPPARLSPPRKWTIFFALVALSAALRLYRMDRGFWYDEIRSTFIFFRAPWKTLFTTMPIPNHHPLYSLLAKISISLFGEAEWSARLPAFLFGAFTPGLLFLFGSRWLRPTTGILAGFFFSVALWPVWFSQDARGYAAAIFFSLLATHLFLSAAEKFSWAAGLGFILAGMAALYSHLYSGATLGGLLLFALFLSFRSRPEGRRLVLLGGIAICVSVLLYLPMYGDLLRYTGEAGMITTGRAVRPGFVTRLVLSWAAGERLLFLSGVLVPVAAAGFYATAKQAPAVAWSWLFSLVAGLLVPLVIGLFVYYRFYSYLLPGYFLFLAAGVTACAEWSGRWRRVVLAGGGLAASAVLLSGLGLYYVHGKQAFKEARAWIQANAPYYRPQIIGIATHVYWYYDDTARKVPWGEPLTPEKLHGTATILSHPWSVSPEDKELLKHACREAEYFLSAGSPEYDVRIYLCD